MKFQWYFLINYNIWVTAKAGTFLRFWDFWLVEEQQEEPGNNNNSLFWKESGGQKYFRNRQTATVKQKKQTTLVKQYGCEVWVW